jgi:hypothetical protein
MRQQPQETLRQLSDLFPGFDDWWKDENTLAADGSVDDVHYEWTHHDVMRQFLGFFGQHHNSFTEAELRGLGEWVNRAVVEEDAVENAVATCFLEHMRQVGINRVLAPYLSRTAKQKSHT